MTNQYMTKLYHDLLSNSPQTVTIDIPADMGTGQISQVVTKQGAVVSDWKMNYFSDMNVQGVSCEDYIQLLFCFNDGVSWNIADASSSASPAFLPRASSGMRSFGRSRPLNRSLRALGAVVS